MRGRARSRGGGFAPAPAAQGLPFGHPFYPLRGRRMTAKSLARNRALLAHSQLVLGQALYIVFFHVVGIFYDKF
jgi:hypothetical protein